MEIIVTGCHSCPFSENEYMGHAEKLEFYLKCNHPQRLAVGYYARIELIKGKTVLLHPGWCPLKKESITITLKQ